MAVMKIYRMGDDVLRKKAHEVKEINRRTVALIKDMAETMYAADGCGLAAPQVGVLKRIIVIDCDQEDGRQDPITLINPEILELKGELVTEKRAAFRAPAFPYLNAAANTLW